MSQYSNSPPSSVSGVIEAVGRDLARDQQEKTHGFETENGPARGTLPRAKRYSDRPMDLRLERPSVVIEAPDMSEEADTQPLTAQPVTMRMRRLPS